jgi:23S rRNA (cytosine1962-C5)-methyltransferase
MKADVLTGLDALKDQDYDLVVCDPPALIKGRKDIPTGTHAYLQLNTQVFRIVKRGGFVVSCSCSGLLEEESFLKVLSKAAYRNKVPVRWIARGSQAPDHPMRIEFPEGRYLKAWIGYVG